MSAGDRPLREWTRGITTPDTRLADRTATRRAALALVRIAERLDRWQQRARGVGYFDEGYAASQLWKADWERRDGDAVVSRARALVRQIDPLEATGGDP